MENKEHIGVLFRKYLNDAHTEAELDEILRYFHQAEEEDTLLELIEQELDKIPDTNTALITSMGDRVARNLFQHTRPESTRLFKWWLPYAAALLFIGAASLIVYKIAGNPKVETKVVQSNENIILPGGNRATIRLDNGKVLTLNEDQQSIINKGDALLYADGSAIEKLEHTQLITLMTPRAGQYAVTLSDGTKVWLNAASELVYPAHFDRQERNVQLKGEAYFEVAHDKNKPFIVQTERQRIQVLGTRFNVHAYADEKVQHTTLMQGAVMIENKIDQTSLRLKPGQQAISELNYKLSVHQVNPQEYISWKDGIIMLNGYALPEILRQLERWYDVAFDEVPEGVATDRVFGMLNRDVPLNDVLESLEGSYNIQFTIKERRVMLTVK